MCVLLALTAQQQGGPSPTLERSKLRMLCKRAGPGTNPAFSGREV